MSEKKGFSKTSLSLAQRKRVRERERGEQCYFTVSHPPLRTLDVIGSKVKPDCPVYCACVHSVQPQ